MQKPELTPIDISPDLTPDRLEELARVVTEARRKVFHDLRKYGAWGTGCTAYEHVHAVLEREQGRLPWLTVEKAASLSWVILVGATPLKVAREESTRKGSNQVEKKALEDARRFQMAFDLGSDAAEQHNKVLRLEIIDSSEDPVAGLFLKQYDERDFKLPLWSWELPVPEESFAEVVQPDLPEGEAPEPVMISFSKSQAEPGEQGQG